MKLPKALLLIPLLWLLAVSGNAQTQQVVAPKDELFRTIAALDSEVFDAYNRCDLEKFGSFFPEDLEFYHDNGGLVSQTRQSLVEAVKNNICGKVYRVLVPESLEVYPLKGYGAVETGVHRFYHPGRDSTEEVGEAKFVQIWQNKDGVWKITRVISYDHHALAR
ncbi:MAG TPA: nuclear transport factor 2 family protein [Thermoanaerobaculia bacterium]|nr:nuclear transport factor 2 family protein [Thermoanaerobaculia bacterium]